MSSIEKADSKVESCKVQEIVEHKEDNTRPTLNSSKYSVSETPQHEASNFKSGSIDDKLTESLKSGGQNSSLSTPSTSTGDETQSPQEEAQASRDASGEVCSFWNTIVSKCFEAGVLKFDLSDLSLESLRDLEKKVQDVKYKIQILIKHKVSYGAAESKSFEKKKQITICSIRQLKEAVQRHKGSKASKHLMTARFCLSIFLKILSISTFVLIFCNRQVTFRQILPEITPALWNFYIVIFLRQKIMPELECIEGFIPMICDVIEQLCITASFLVMGLNLIVSCFD